MTYPDNIYTTIAQVLTNDFSEQPSATDVGLTRTSMAQKLEFAVAERQGLEIQDDVPELNEAVIWLKNEENDDAFASLTADLSKAYFG